jgi:arabinogalactan endo-1,4-beta-galactosidase
MRAQTLALLVAALMACGAAAAAPKPVVQAASPTIRGGDISSLKKSEDLGGVYRDATGAQRDPIQLLRADGVNYARLRIWVNPADGYDNKARVLQMAALVKAQGMKLLVDFHYSDTWADPGHQAKPAAWRSLSFSQLVAAVSSYTFDVCNSLRAQGTPADMVQIGNEINGGMLWPEGSTSNWNNLAALLKSGISAARSASSSTRIMLHIANGGDNAGTRWWFDQAVAHGVPFDVIGLSHYVYWHGTLAALQRNLNDVSARYGKDVVVAETAYGFTLAQGDAESNIFTSALQRAGGYAATAQGQAAMLRDIFNVVRAVPNGRGLGVFYWEPTWTVVPGNGWDPTNPRSGNQWENQAVFDYSGRALPAASVFGQV